MNKNILMSSGRLIRDFLAARGTLKRRPFHRRQSLAPQASQRPDLSGNQKTPPPSLEKRSSCDGTCGPSGETLDFSFYKVLVAEDNQINQRVIQKMLEKTGVRFKIVQSGMEVLEALRDEYFDLVLMDCYMGGMDGFEAAKAIRASKERFAQIPLIAFSAGMFDSDRQASRDAGMDDFLSKPLRYESLQAKLLEWVSRIDKKLPVLDVTALDKIRVFDDQHCSLLRSLFQIYSENTQDELSQMRDLILDVDMDRVRKKAHMLKSSAAQLGALRFERICILMESEASLTIERAQLLYKTMCKEYEDSRQRFAEYCRSLSQAAGVPLKDSLSL